MRNLLSEKALSWDLRTSNVKFRKLEPVKGLEESEDVGRRLRGNPGWTSDHRNSLHTRLLVRYNA